MRKKTKDALNCAYKSENPYSKAQEIENLLADRSLFVNEQDNYSLRIRKMKNLLSKV